MSKTKELAHRLERATTEEALRLRSISDNQAQTRPGGGAGWSRKQELGHLLDSAANNRVRFIVASLQGGYVGATYDGLGWVDLGGYADFEWTDLVDLWQRTNLALAQVVRRIPEERLSVECRVGSNQPVTLDFLIDDYILHMQHHLDHVLARDQMTAYPGAAIGV